ncbi:MAG: hypothetical protein IMY72_06635 [Bacteroidetes bacterium]|nr:hypothetical protein [Bacteroidota bacterium]
MKKLILIFIVSIIYSGTSFSQNNEGKSDDVARISITPMVKDNSIPKIAQKMLINKMKQICTLNGMAGDGKNPYFTMDASVDVLSKEITPTAPPMHALYLSINLSISDKDGKVFSQTSIEVKGVGRNEAKAYIQGIKHINTRKGQYKAFIEQGKTKIIEYYNSNCDFFISTANTLNSQGYNNDAIRILYSVPPVCKECYDKCMELASQIKPTEDEATAPLPVSAQTKVTPEDTQANVASKDTNASATTNIGDNPGAVKNVSENDWSKFGSLPNSKVVYKKGFKWATAKLPIDNLGNFSWKSAIKVEGKVTRFQYTLPSENNSEYVLKIYKELLAVANYNILVSLGNDESSHHRPGYNYYTYLKNDKFGWKYRCRYDYTNSTFLVTKAQVGKEDVYFVFFIMEQKDATIITQDIIQVPK